MIGVDTNFLLRVLLQDDVDQAQTAERRLEALTRDGGVVFVSSVVLAEIAWVLRRLQKADRGATAATISSILTSGNIRLEDEQAATAALEDYRSSQCDFADALIGRLAEQAGCSTTWTFDRKAAPLPTFTAA